MTAGLALSPSWLRWLWRQRKSEPARMGFGPVFPRTFGVFDRAAVAAAPGGVDWSTWFDHCWVAKGAASLAASYTDLVGDADLTVGVAPSLDASGWVFTSTQYLQTGIVAAEGWSALCHFSDLTDWGCLFGSGVQDGGSAFGYMVGKGWGQSYPANGGSGSTFEQMDSGSYGFAGQVAYKNGAVNSDFAGIPVGDWLEPKEIFIGNGNLMTWQSMRGKMQALGIKHGILDASAMAAAHAAMAAL